MVKTGNTILVYADGGSRGNPGPAAFGVVIYLGGQGGQKKEYAEFIGKATNNQAEYAGVIFALQKIKQLIGKEAAKHSAVEINIDSELLAKQVNGEYKITEHRIQELFLELWNLKIDFDQVSFRHLRRERNKEADRLANLALDREESGKLKI